MISHTKLLTLLTRKTSVTLNISEQIVDEVMTHQWKSAQEAVKKTNSIEISGLGKFSVREKTCSSKLKTLIKNKEFLIKKLSTVDTDDSREMASVQKKIDDISEDIEFLKTKNHE